jgi:hypothetical protein
MSWLSTSDLAWMRTEVLNALPDTAVIKVKTRTSDGAGGWTETTAATANGTVSCRLDPMRSSQGMIDEAALKEVTVMAYQLTVPYDAPLVEDAQIEVDGKTYEVLKLDDVHSWNVTRRAIIHEVR